MTDAGPLNEEWSSMVVVGRIARTHGRLGEVVVDPLTDFPEQRFAPGGTVYVTGDEGVSALRVVSARFQGARPVMGLAGVETMTDARRLAGKEIRIPSSQQQPLPDGCYYTHALVGCEVRTRDERVVGMVVGVEQAAGASRLVVEPSGPGGDIDIPLVDPICVLVDTDAKLVVVDPPDGLLELNRRA